MRKFLIPFNKNSNYVDSYKELFQEEIQIINEEFTALKILLLPFRATIIIEDIHIYWYLYFIRLDLILIHLLIMNNYQIAFVEGGSSQLQQHWQKKLKRMY